MSGTTQGIYFAIRKNFFKRIRRRIISLLEYARKHRVIPKFMAEPVWQDFLRYWNSEEFQKLSEKGKKARSSKKGGSLHTAGAISQIAGKDGM